MKKNFKATNLQKVNGGGVFFPYQKTINLLEKELGYFCTKTWKIFSRSFRV